MMIGRLIQTALITISSGACLTQAPTFNNEVEPNNAILTETTTVSIDEYRIQENYFGQEIWEYEEGQYRPQSMTYFAPEGHGIAAIMKHYKLIYEVPNNFGTIVINSYRYMVNDNDRVEGVKVLDRTVPGQISLALDIIEINAAKTWEEIKPRIVNQLYDEYWTGPIMSIYPYFGIKYQDQTQPRTVYNSPTEIMNEYRDIDYDLPENNTIQAKVFIDNQSNGIDATNNYDPYARSYLSYEGIEGGDMRQTYTAQVYTENTQYIRRSENENSNYCALSVLTAYSTLGTPNISQNTTSYDTDTTYGCTYEFTLTKEVNTNPTTPEIVDLPGVMYTVLSMPFSFISQAFNLTLFAGTPYAVNIADIFLGILTFIILIFLIRLIIRNQA